jgi:hypothetical protein
MSPLEFSRRQPCGRNFPVGLSQKSPVMSEQEIIVPPPQPRRQDARDLQSRLYREIGVAAVEAALFAPTMELSARHETSAERPVRTVVLRRNAA